MKLMRWVKKNDIWHSSSAQEYAFRTVSVLTNAHGIEGLFLEEVQI